jgi:Zn-finger protein
VKTKKQEENGSRDQEAAEYGAVVDCHLVHKKEIAQKILDCLMQEGDTDELVKVAWKKVMEPII